MKRSILLWLLTFALFIPSAQAWEKDLHYGLTLWLSLQAGFGKSEALTIAKWTQAEDEGHINPATWMMIHVFLFGDEPGSLTVSEKHFPTAGIMNTPPARRPVIPDSKQAHYRVDAAIGYSGPDELVRLGAALHPLQDSWSHQGIPDTPLRPGEAIHANLSWSHPEARGGWFSHNADITSIYPRDAIATAQATYQALLDFRTKHPSSGEKEPKKWEELLPEVESFAHAATKAKKQAWFAAHLGEAGVNAAELVADIDVPGETSLPERIVRIAELQRKVPGANIPPRVLEAIGNFLKQLFQKQEVGSASEYLSARDLQHQFGDGVLRNDDEARKWGRKFMTTLLTADHGAVNTAGHGFPLAEGYAALPEQPQKEGKYKAVKTSLENEPRAESIAPMEFFGVGPVFAVVLGFSDEPNDSVVILSNADGRIVRMFWTIL